MWVIRLILLLVLVIALALVLAANMGQTVDLNFIGYEYLDTPLLYVVAACYALGFLTALVVMGLREWRHQRRIAGLKRELKLQERELAELRSLPLQELSGETAGRGD